MRRRNNAQLNIRSDYARERVDQLVRETGKSARQVVEEAVRAYHPPPPRAEDVPEGMIRKGRFLVWKGDGAPITLEGTNRAIEEGRNRDLWDRDED